ncbi:MAG: hypothetical protein ACQEWU_05110 [Bacillota bacterium]
MLKKAQTKIKDEMKKDNNPYVKLIGQFLLDHLTHNPEDAEKILVKSKTIKGSLDSMRKEAEKKKVGNMAVLTDEEGFATVFDYFEIAGNPKAVTPTVPANQGTTETDLVFNVTLGG